MRVKSSGTGKVTSSEVARAAGVSRTTVSFVLNDKPGSNISAETRARVLEAARQLDYVPDANARNLATGKTRTIALAVHKPSPHAFADTYLSSVLSGLVRKAKEAGFRIVLELTEEDSEVSTLAALVRSGAVDGLIATGWQGEEPFEEVGLSANDPVLLLSEWPFERFSNISVDLVGAQRKIVNAALAAGHRQFGCIPYVPFKESVSEKRRFEDFKNQLASAGAELLPGCVEAGDLTVESGRLAMRRILEAPVRPSVVFGMNDTMAIGAIKAAQGAGISVPEDISVIGFEGQAITEYLDPPISTVKIPWIDLGEKAAEIMLHKLRNPEAEQSRLSIGSELQLRRSLI
nr:LacI family DNA-binding transcriptional regulator [Shimia sp. R10_1]